MKFIWCSNEAFLLVEDALQGIQDLLGKNPAELKLHKFALVEKLRERVGDNNESVRKALYQLFKSVIFPGCKEVGYLFP